MSTCTSSRAIVPPVDIHESKEGVTIEAELPGVKPDAVNVEIRDGRLYLRAHRNGVDSADAMRYSERVRGDYLRAFQLNDTIDPGSVTAQLRDGVLRVTLQRREKDKPRQVEIS